jgi:hypothetical protein
MDEVYLSVKLTIVTLSVSYESKGYLKVKTVNLFGG